MPENNFTLPDFIIADLYKNSLVEIENDENPVNHANKSSKDAIEFAEPEAAKPENFYFGKNEKFVSIILNEPEAEFINEDDLQFLTNILKACKLSVDDIAIINFRNHQKTFNDLKELMSTRYFLLFGVEPTDIKLPFIIPHFQVQQYAGCTIVTAPALHDINKNSDEGKLVKTKLWLSLQRCFDIK